MKALKALLSACVCTTLLNACSSSPPGDGQNAAQTEETAAPAAAEAKPQRPIPQVAAPIPPSPAGGDEADRYGVRALEEQAFGPLNVKRVYF